MAASYPSTTKTFSTKNTGDTIAASHVDELQDEVVAIENGLRSGLAHDLLPLTDDSQDLGSASKQWQDVFVSGQITASGQVRASAYNSAVQSVNDSAATILTFDSEDYDVGGVHSTSANTSRMTVPAGKGGLYLVIGSTSIAVDADGYRRVVLFKNGATALQIVSVAANAATLYTAMQVSGVFVLAAADYVELQVLHTAGAATDVGSTGRSLASSLQLVRLW
jgi:hypothetical protein